MKFIHYYILVIILGLCVVPSVCIWAQDNTEKETAFDPNYAIIFERNIFSRDRQPYQTPDESSPAPAPPEAPMEASFILRGISKELTKTIAFVEQTDQGSIQKYEVGSSIAKGRISSLTLDGLTYEVHTDPNDPNAVKVTQVKVGQSLLGQAQANGSEFRGNTRGSDDRFGRRSRNREDRRSRENERPSESTDNPPSLNGTDPSEILRQLMERRQREMGN